MSRVCPKCRLYYPHDLETCRECGGQTLHPNAWKKIRRAGPPGAPPPLPVKTATPPPSEEIQDNWQQIGMGGMFAFLLFFLIFLIVYLNLAA